MSGVEIGEVLQVARASRCPVCTGVLTVEGFVADGFVPAEPNVPAGEVAVRDLLRREGVEIDARGRAAAVQHFGAED